METATATPAAAEAVHVKKLKTFLAEILDLDEDFADTAHFMKDLGVSSLMGLEVMVAMEKIYHVKFKEDELKNLTTVLNVFQALKEKNAKFE